MGHFPPLCPFTYGLHSHLRGQSLCKCPPWSTASGDPREAGDRGGRTRPAPPPGFPGGSSCPWRPGDLWSGGSPVGLKKKFPHDRLGLAALPSAPAPSRAPSPPHVSKQTFRRLRGRWGSPLAAYRGQSREETGPEPPLEPPLEPATWAGEEGGGTAGRARPGAGLAPSALPRWQPGAAEGGEEGAAS